MHAETKLSKQWKLTTKVPTCKNQNPEFPKPQVAKTSRPEQNKKKRSNKKDDSAQVAEGGDTEGKVNTIRQSKGKQRTENTKVGNMKTITK